MGQIIEKAMLMMKTAMKLSMENQRSRSNGRAMLRRKGANDSTCANEQSLIPIAIFRYISVPFSVFELWSLADSEQ